MYEDSVAQAGLANDADLMAGSIEANAGPTAEDKAGDLQIKLQTFVSDFKSWFKNLFRKKHEDEYSQVDDLYVGTPYDHTEQLPPEHITTPEDIMADSGPSGYTDESPYPDEQQYDEYAMVETPEAPPEAVEVSIPENYVPMPAPEVIYYRDPNTGLDYVIMYSPEYHNIAYVGLHEYSVMIDEIYKSDPGAFAIEKEECYKFLYSANKGQDAEYISSFTGPFSLQEAAIADTDIPPESQQGSTTEVPEVVPAPTLDTPPTEPIPIEDTTETDEIKEEIGTQTDAVNSDPDIVVEGQMLPPPGYISPPNFKIQYEAML